MKTRRPVTRALEKDKLKAEYNNCRSLYERLAVNIQQALKTFLAEHHIPHLDIAYRIKDFDSAFEKIERKKYQQPFVDMEDWCGLRVICYYPSDVARICEIIEREFEVHEEEDKATRLSPHEFGYRSTHFIVRVKDAWLQAPNYRGLGNLKAEIQVRTILMHAWAEIEHKLAYKSTEQVPDKFRRRLYRLSAKFEETDEQFDELRANLTEYRAQLRTNARKTGEFNKGLELNLDTLQAFLDLHFQNRDKDIEATSDLLAEIQPLGLSMADLVDAYQKAESVLSAVEKDERDESDDESEFVWSQVGALRTILDLGNEKYFSWRLGILGKLGGWWESTHRWRERLGR